MKDPSYLYGLENSNHDFTAEKAFGKNIFTNAFPVSLALYMDRERSLEQNYLFASLDKDGLPKVASELKPLGSIINVDPDRAYWSFEDSFSGYDEFATGAANRSDLVVKDTVTGTELSAFEVKLVAAPTSGTANREREQQSCEIVVRPATIEQMCFSIASSYGKENRHDISDIVADKLVYPMDYQWSNESYMLERLPCIVNAAEEIIRQGIGDQTPFVLNALWRTVGTSTMLDDECFDVFFWSDLAFLQLFTNAAKRSLQSETKNIGRPARSLIWLVKSLLDYAMQGTVTFERTHSLITFGGQTDKAGAFSGNSVMSLLGCYNFYHPRIGSDEYRKIITPEGIDLLSPERRLDSFIKNDYDLHSRIDYGTVSL